MGERTGLPEKTNKAGTASSRQGNHPERAAIEDIRNMHVPSGSRAPGRHIDGENLPNTGRF